MKLLFDNGPELVVWTENEKLIMEIDGVKYEMEGQDLMNFSTFVESHKKKVLEEQDNKRSLLEKVKTIWNPIA